MISKIEQAQLDVLDVLIEAGGYWTGPDREVLIELAREVHGDDAIDSTDARYKATSLAVLKLEAEGLVSVERRFSDEAQRANIIEAIHLA